MLLNIIALRHYIIGQAFFLLCVFTIVYHYTSADFWKYPMDNLLDFNLFSAFLIMYCSYSYLKSELTDRTNTFIWDMTKVYGLVLLLASAGLSYFSETLFGIHYRLGAFLITAWIISAPLLFLRMALWIILWFLKIIGISYVNYKVLEEMAGKYKRGKLNPLEEWGYIYILNEFNSRFANDSESEASQEIITRHIKPSDLDIQESITKLNDKWWNYARIPIFLLIITICSYNVFDVGKWIYNQYKAENRVAILSIDNHKSKESEWIHVANVKDESNVKIYYDKNSTFIDDTNGIINVIWKYAYSSKENDYSLYCTTFKIGSADYATTDYVEKGVREYRKEYITIEKAGKNSVIAAVYETALHDHGNSEVLRGKYSVTEYLERLYKNGNNRLKYNDGAAHLAYDYTPIINDNGKIINVLYYSLEDRKKIKVDVLEKKKNTILIKFKDLNGKEFVGTVSDGYLNL